MQIVMNPPYGERIGTDDIEVLYKNIGSTLKHRYEGSDAWILSSNREALKRIGLKSESKICLYNGQLESQLVHFGLFKGKLEDFKKNSFK